MDPNTPLCECFPLGAQGNQSVLKLHFPSLQGFYNQVATPLLLDVELQYPKDTVSELTQHSHKQYYEGSEIVVAGRIADQKLKSFKADVRAHAVNSGPWRVERPSSTQRLQTYTVPHSCIMQLFLLPEA